MGCRTAGARLLGDSLNGGSDGDARWGVREDEMSPRNGDFEASVSTVSPARARSEAWLAGVGIFNAVTRGERGNVW